MLFQNTKNTALSTSLPQCQTFLPCPVHNEVESCVELGSLNNSLVHQLLWDVGGLKLWGSWSHPIFSHLCSKNCKVTSSSLFFLKKNSPFFPLGRFYPITLTPTSIVPRNSVAQFFCTPKCLFCGFVL